MISVELLVTQYTSARGKRMLYAMAEACPRDFRIAEHAIYTGSCDWLMLFGAGGLDRYPAYLRHRAAGKRTVVFDLGYWDRENCQRVAVDAEHCWNMLYSVEPTRPGYPCELRDDYDPDGHVLFAAMGDKSKKQYGERWDAERIAELARSEPERRIVVRPKPARKKNSDLPPIAKALRGCSRVVTHHSNVAIDGVIAGIPHSCLDGAAKALRPTRDPDVRRDFLDRLGMWQWKPSEAAELWTFLRGLP